MCPCGSHLEGPFDVLLAFNVSEVFMIDRLLPKQRRQVAQRLWNRLRAVKKADSLRQRRHAEDRHILDDGRLGSIFRWHDHALQPGLAQRQSHWHGPSNGLDAAIEGQFADHEIAMQALGLDIARRLQEPQCDGQIKRRAFFAHVRRRQIHRGALDTIYLFPFRHNTLWSLLYYYSRVRLGQPRKFWRPYR